MHRRSTLAALSTLATALLLAAPGTATAAPGGAGRSAAPPVAPAAEGPGTTLIPGESVRVAPGTFDTFEIAGRADTPGAADSWSASVTVRQLAGCITFTGPGAPAWMAITGRAGGGALGGLVTRLAMFDDHAALVADFTSDELRSCVGAGTLPTDRYHLVGAEWRDTNPAGVRAADGSYDLFAGGWLADRRYVPGRGWQPAALLGGGRTNTGVTALRLPDGTARAFLVGTDRKLYYGDVTGGRHRFLGWVAVGGSLNFRPYPVLLPDRSVAVFAESTNGELVEALWRSTGVFSWVHLGGPAALHSGGPAAASTGGGRITVVVPTDAHTLATRSLLPATGWGAWQAVSGQASGSLGAASPAAGVFDLYISGANSGHPLYTRRATNGGWGGWTNLGGSLLPGGPFAAASAGGRTDVWVQGADGRPYQRVRTGTSFAGWAKLPTPRP